MGAKMTTMEMMRIAETVGNLPRKNRDQIETILREKRCEEEGRRVAKYNERVAAEGVVTDAEATAATRGGSNG